MHDNAPSLCRAGIISESANISGEVTITGGESV